MWNSRLLDGVSTCRGIYCQLTDGGVILVDDVKSDRYNWDGAYQAYIEFCSELGLQPDFLGGKCGLLRKNGSLAIASRGVRKVA
jgi:hypothetical protein